MVYLPAAGCRNWMQSRALHKSAAAWRRDAIAAQSLHCRKEGKVNRRTKIVIDNRRYRTQPSEREIDFPDAYLRCASLLKCLSALLCNVRIHAAHECRLTYISVEAGLKELCECSSRSGHPASPAHRSPVTSDDHTHRWAVAEENGPSTTAHL